MEPTDDPGGTQFNLLDEAWIPVLYADGRVARVGIKQALADAGRIREIAASNPMDREQARPTHLLTSWPTGASRCQRG